MPIYRISDEERRYYAQHSICLALNHLGLVIGWDCDTANVHDSRFNHLSERFVGQMVIH